LGLVPLQPTEKYMRNIPIKVFEYMACGLPVLGADLPPIARYIEESGAGRVYDSTSVESLAANVLDMLANEAELARMSKNGLRAVRERWNWERMEARLLEAYDELDAQIRQRRTGSGRGQARSVPSR
jgi:glycosyltransferase involved in cell wall biosynthesis